MGLSPSVAAASAGRDMGQQGAGQHDEQWGSLEVVVGGGWYGTHRAARSRRDSGAAREVAAGQRGGSTGGSGAAQGAAGLHEVQPGSTKAARQNGGSTAGAAGQDGGSGAARGGWRGRGRARRGCPVLGPPLPGTFPLRPGGSGAAVPAGARCHLGPSPGCCRARPGPGCAAAAAGAVSGAAPGPGPRPRPRGRSWRRLRGRSRGGGAGPGAAGPGRAGPYLGTAPPSASILSLRAERESSARTGTPALPG